MSGGLIIATWRMRAIARVVATLICAGFCLLLWLSSRGLVQNRDEPRSVEVFITQRDPDRVERPRERTASARGERADAPPVATSNVEAQMLRRLLSCVVRPGQQRPAHCPRDAAPEDWRAPQLQVGGDFAQPEPLDMDQIYTQAEQRTIVTPSCRRDGGGSACIPIGPRPPPPSRSAEEVCAAENLGGPCRPPPDPAP